MAILKYKNSPVFCSYCGAKLDEAARFCKSCGKSVNQTNEAAERKSVYEGSLHKCPNCGEVLKSFAANCPSCGHEIRDTAATGSIRELALKLEKIETQKMPAFEEKRSVMKMIIGKDFNDEDKAGEARRHFEIQKNQEKANAIMHYPVPYTKEDIMEFMLLASSNINLKGGADDVVNNAWVSKLEQAYEKAKLSMGSSSDFIYIQNIYEQTKKQIMAKKVRVFLRYAGVFFIWVFLMGLLWNPGATIAISVVLMIIALVLYKKILFRKN